jgi:hypothetical protein
LEIELEKMVIHVKEKKAADTRFTRIVWEYKAHIHVPLSVFHGLLHTVNSMISMLLLRVYFWYHLLNIFILKAIHATQD